MDGCNASGMSCIPGLQQCVSFCAPNFPDYNACWLQAHARSQAIQRRYAARSVETNIVPHLGLQLDRVFDRHHSIVWSNARDGIKTRIQKSRFAGPRGANDEDVSLCGDGSLDNLRMTQTTDRM